MTKNAEKTMAAFWLFSRHDHQAQPDDSGHNRQNGDDVRCHLGPFGSNYRADTARTLRVLD
jgi:hypothetical protein